MPLSPHSVTVEGKKFYFLAVSGLYDGAIGIDCGISPATDSEKDNPLYPVEELLKKGIIYRLNATTTTRGKRSRLKLLADKEAIRTNIFTSLVGENYSITNGSSGTIVSVNIPSRVTSRA
jgi:hypothetical protein